MGQLRHSSQHNRISLSLFHSLSFRFSDVLQPVRSAVQRLPFIRMALDSIVRSSPKKAAILTGQLVISVSCQNNSLTLPSIITTVITTVIIPTLNCLCSRYNIFRSTHCTFNPLNPELNPICYLLAFQELTIFSTLAG